MEDIIVRSEACVLLLVEAPDLAALPDRLEAELLAEARRVDAVDRLDDIARVQHLRLTTRQRHAFLRLLALVAVRLVEHIWEDRLLHGTGSTRASSDETRRRSGVHVNLTRFVLGVLPQLNTVHLAIHPRRERDRDLDKGGVLEAIVARAPPFRVVVRRGLGHAVRPAVVVVNKERRVRRLVRAGIDDDAVRLGVERPRDLRCDFVIGRRIEDAALRPSGTLSIPHVDPSAFRQLVANLNASWLRRAESSAGFIIVRILVVAPALGPIRSQNAHTTSPRELPSASVSATPALRVALERPDDLARVIERCDRSRARDQARLADGIDGCRPRRNLRRSRAVFA